MRIGVNALFLIPEKVGGSETYLRETLRALLDNHAGVEVVVFTNRENHDLVNRLFGTSAHFEARLLDFRATNRFTRVLREQFQLPMAVRMSGVDILWSPGYTSPLLCHCPQVVTIHDMQYKEYPEDFTRLARFALNVLVRASAKHCDLVITDSEFGRRQIVTHCRIPEARTRVVQPGVSSHFLSTRTPDSRDYTARLTGSQRPYLLFVGNTYPHKNVHLLVEAFATILEDIEHSLVIVGTPDRGEELVNRASVLLSDPSRLIRLCYQSEDDLVTLYRAADLFVFPSLYEGFGLPILEAMMAGTPVLTTRCAAIPEVAGDCARYFDETSRGDLAAAIREMLTMESLNREDWTQHARVRAQEFTWERTACDTLNIFREVLDRE